MFWQYTIDNYLPELYKHGISPSSRPPMRGHPIFPCLDMEMFYEDNQDLSFGVFTKPNCKSKYLNIGSSHPKKQKQKVTRGVSICLAGLTTRIVLNEEDSVSKLYPVVHKSLQNSGHLGGDSKLPTLGKIIDDCGKEMMEAQIWEVEWQKDQKSVHNITQYSGYWHTPIHKIITNIRDNQTLGWLQVRVVYKRHMNLKEVLLKDVQAKYMNGALIEPKKYRQGKQKKAISGRPTSLKALASRVKNAKPQE